jgi:hypothetical protein
MVYKKLIALDLNCTSMSSKPSENAVHVNFTVEVPFSTSEKIEMNDMATDGAVIDYVIDNVAADADLPILTDNSVTQHAPNLLLAKGAMDDMKPEKSLSKMPSLKKLDAVADEDTDDDPDYGIESEEESDEGDSDNENSQISSEQEDGSESDEDEDNDNDDDAGNESSDDDSIVADNVNLVIEGILATCTANCIQSGKLICSHGVDVCKAETKREIADLMGCWRYLALLREELPIHHILLRDRMFTYMLPNLRQREGILNPIGILSVFNSRPTDNETTAAFGHIMKQRGGFQWFLDHYQGNSNKVYELLANCSKVSETSITICISYAVASRQLQLLTTICKRVADSDLAFTAALVIIWECYKEGWEAGFIVAQNLLDMDAAVSDMANSKDFLRKLLVEHGCTCRLKMNGFISSHISKSVMESVRIVDSNCAYCQTSRVGTEGMDSAAKRAKTISDNAREAKQENPGKRKKK